MAGGQITGDENGQIEGSIHHPAEQLAGTGLLNTDLEAGVAVLEGHQTRGEIVGAHHVGDPDPHFPPLQPLELGHLGLGLMHLQQQTLGMATEHLSLRSEPYRPVLSIKQPQLELLLQLGDGHADGGLGHMQSHWQPW